MDFFSVLVVTINLPNTLIMQIEHLLGPMIEFGKSVVEATILPGARKANCGELGVQNIKILLNYITQTYRVTQEGW